MPPRSYQNKWHNKSHQIPIAPNVRPWDEIMDVHIKAHTRLMASQHAHQNINLIQQKCAITKWIPQRAHPTFCNPMRDQWESRPNVDQLQNGSTWTHIKYIMCWWYQSITSPKPIQMTNPITAAPCHSHRHMLLRCPTCHHKQIFNRIVIMHNSYPPKIIYHAKRSWPWCGVQPTHQHNPHECTT